MQLLHFFCGEVMFYLQDSWPLPFQCLQGVPWLFKKSGTYIIQMIMASLYITV